MHDSNASYCQNAASCAKGARVAGLLLLVALLAALVALPLGAKPLGVWTPIGPADSAIRALVSGNGVLYTATDRGVQRSEDRGRHWRTLDLGPNLNVAFLAVDPERGDVLYASGSQLSRSFDGGATWQVLPYDCGAVVQIVIAPSRPRTLYVFGFASGHPGYYSLAKSTDRGETWTCHSVTSFREGGFLAIDSGNPDTVYLGAEGIFKSTDSGAEGSWVLVRRSDSLLPFIGAIAVDPSSPGTVYATSSLAVGKSVDGGHSWTVSSAGFAQPITGGFSLNTDLDILLFDRSDPMTLYTGAAGFEGPESTIADGGIGVFVSHDAGATWMHISRGLPRGSFNAVLALDSSTGLLFAGTADRGVYVFTPAAP
jgi:hypothetical protein